MILKSLQDEVLVCNPLMANVFHALGRDEDPSPALALVGEALDVLEADLQAAEGHWDRALAEVEAMRPGAHLRGHALAADEALQFAFHAMTRLDPVLCTGPVRRMPGVFRGMFPEHAAEAERLLPETAPWAEAPPLPPWQDTPPPRPLRASFVGLDTLLLAAATAGWVVLVKTLLL